MSENEVREPIQKRSIEKKEKIIQLGFELICQKGYHNTNTAEIAKYAGVSTGIVYNYFKDKHDILIEGVKKYASDIFYPMLSVPNEKIDKNNLEKILRKMINNYINNHKLSQSAHEELISMAHSDKEIAEFFHQHEINVTIQITNILINSGFDSTNLIEKVHIALGLIDNLCHEIVYHKHENIDYKIMTDIVINNILKL